MNELRYALGIDAGHASIGWAVIELDAHDRPIRLAQAGVRRFDAGVEGDVERGKDESLSQKRREARGPRRQTWRRQWRLRKVFRVLRSAGLLPDSPNDDHDARHALLLELDHQLLRELVSQRDRVTDQVFHYRLRAQALDQPLPPHAIGRALYHLAQRRGFLSNLKTGRDSDERSVVKKGIAELDEVMRTAKARTLGEYFSTLDPEQQRIRSRWTSRRMYREEFERIWKAQRPHCELLTDPLKTRLEDAIFHQRPLKSQRGLIGRCDLEPTKRRAPVACLPFQQFRVLQRLNDLEVICPDGELRKLNPEERGKLHDALEREGDLTWAAIRKLLGMKRSRKYGRTYEFNFQRGGDKKMLGNRTAAKLAPAVGETWNSLSAAHRTELVDDILAFESEEELVRHLQRRWNLSEAHALAVADLRLEDGYGSVSRRAIRKLVPCMENGTPFATCRKQFYGEMLQAKKSFEFLPPLSEAMGTIRNPAVTRTMAELRKIVNALIRRYGRPEIVRIELARDLKHSRERRKQMTDFRDRNTKSRDAARERLLKERGDRYATDRNVLKLRLAEECNWQCPYTGRSFGMEELVGDHPQFDIEHIIPFGRSLDNSFANKTLCYHEENRRRKRGKTPFEAYGQSPDWTEILDGVRHFQGDCAARKLQLFQVEVLPGVDEFIDRQLNDTRYLSRVAAEYLAVLYGGRWDEQGKLRVQVSPGRVTGYLRRAWDLNRILGRPDDKNRVDHRHHAIDAFLIGVSEPKIVKKLSEAAERADELGGHDLFVKVDPPWPGFDWNHVRDAVKLINVSSRVNRKLAGALHQETILGKPQPAVDRNGKPTTVHHVRKRLDAMSIGEIRAIVDNVVRRAVEEKLAQIGGDPKKAFADPNNHPYLIARDGRLIPIHSARIVKPDATIDVGDGSKRRFVCPGDNHHMEIVAVLDDHRKHTKWKGHIVSRFEAVRRWKDNEPIIKRDHGLGREFVFSLTNGEHVVIQDGGENQQLLRVTVISGQQIEFVAHNDARPITVRKKIRGERIRLSVDSMRERGVTKVAVDPTGELQPAGD